MKCLTYPFDSGYIMQKKKSIRRELLASDRKFLEKRIAILGGSTTNDVKNILDLFLLDYGIKAEFYESEYNQYYQDAMFDPKELMEFKPDIIYIHTSNRNIRTYPTVRDTVEQVDEKLDMVYSEFEAMWKHLGETYGCLIIQNNMELPSYRLLGNSDVSDIHGRVNFIGRLNEKFNEYARNNENVYINDINYLSACYE
jgi:predicted enzyme involved in methoxymalonyl-ACP biosynthesis